MGQGRFAAAVALVSITGLGSCTGTPKEARQAGFLGTYANLKQVNNQRMSYASPQLRDYTSFMIEPVQFLLPPKELNKKERAEVAEHFRVRITELLEKRGFTVTATPGPGVATILLAMTEVTESPWWLELHPAARMSGAGTGGAALEGEVVDSETGEQLGAVVQAAPGNQFNFTSYSTVAAVTTAIDQWADQAARRLDDLRAEAK